MNISHPIEVIESLFEAKGSLQYGEDVTQLAHALQCGHLAEKDGAPEALVVAAVFHDLGHMIHRDAAQAIRVGADDRHEVLGARWLARWFGTEVTEPIRLHVQAKRFLCAREPKYMEQLSPLSIRTLELQGGPMSLEEANEFETQPYGLQAAQLRRWDDQGKLPELKTPSLRHFTEKAAKLLVTG